MTGTAWTIAAMLLAIPVLGLGTVLIVAMVGGAIGIAIEHRPQNLRTTRQHTRRKAIRR